MNLRRSASIVLAGALLGYLVLRNQSLELRIALVALASGFLITTVTQSMIPEANREGEPGLAGKELGVGVLQVFQRLLHHLRMQ